MNIATSRGLFSTLLTGALLLAGLTVASDAAAQASRVSKKFAGAKVNDGTVTHTIVNGKDVLTLPAYVKDVAKVQIYCAWAKAVLGETTFDKTVGTN